MFCHAHMLLLTQSLKVLYGILELDM